MQNTWSIGVFDSGMGGLTVLKALKESLPHESFIYLGDTARLPYGTKSQDTVKSYAMQMVSVLMNRQIKALVIACNTATTAALSHLQTLYPQMPILGVVRPGAISAVMQTKNQRIGVMATETTIASTAYQKVIHEYLEDAMVAARACSVLVALAEEGMVQNTVAEEALRHYLSEFEDIDTLLLGCTHFPVFKPLLRTLLPASVNIVDSAVATAFALKEALEQQNLMTDAKEPGNCHYLVTDSIRRFQTVGEIFLSEPLSMEAIELVDACPTPTAV